MNKAMTRSTPPDALPRIAFMGDPLAGWGGGIDFLRFCIGALATVAPGSAFTILLPGKRTAWQTLRHWAAPLKRGVKLLLGRNMFHGQPMTRKDLKHALASSGARVELVDYRNSRAGLAKA